MTSDYQSLAAQAALTLALDAPLAWLYTNVQSGDYEASADPDLYEYDPLFNKQPLFTQQQEINELELHRVQHKADTQLLKQALDALVSGDPNLEYATIQAIRQALVLDDE